MCHPARRVFAPSQNTTNARVTNTATTAAMNQSGDDAPVAASTRVSAPDGNYPPSEWLEREGVSGVPTIADDEGSTALAAYGAGRFPYLVYLDADNNVVLRTSGEYGSDPQAYTPVFEALASGEPPVDPRG